jgi:hypothetical protein
MNKERHRFRNHDLPAHIRYDGDQQRYWLNKKGQIHREKDLPSVMNYNGYNCWYKEGICSRKKLPAIICYDGDKCWFI